MLARQIKAKKFNTSIISVVGKSELPAILNKSKFQQTKANLKLRHTANMKIDFNLTEKKLCSVNEEILF